MAATGGHRAHCLLDDRLGVVELVEILAFESHQNIVLYPRRRTPTTAPIGARPEVPGLEFGAGDRWR